MPSTVKVHFKKDRVQFSFSLPYHKRLESGGARDNFRYWTGSKKELRLRADDSLAYESCTVICIIFEIF